MHCEDPVYQRLTDTEPKWERGRRFISGTTEGIEAAQMMAGRERVPGEEIHQFSL